MSPAQSFKEAYEANGLREVHRLDTFTAAELMVEELEPVREIVPGVMPEGVILFAGKPKLGKSWLALGLCVAVASGGAAFGEIPVEQGDALYLALEDNRRRINKRLGKILLGSDPPESLSIAVEARRLDEGGVEQVEAWLSEHPDARLVVVDTLAKIRPVQRGNSVYAEDYGALERLIPLAAQYSVTILVVHHMRKMAAADPLDEISGSTGLSGGVDGIMTLKRDRGQADAYLYVDGRDVEEPRELALCWDDEITGWRIAGNADVYRMSQERRLVVELLRQASEPMAPREIAEALDRTEGSVKMLLGEMVKDGEVAHPGRGQYTIPAYLTDLLTFEGGSKPVSESKEVSKVRDTSRGAA